MTDNGLAKPFMEHLSDLRWMLVKSAVVFVLGVIGCFIYTPELLTILEWPLRQAGQEPASIAVVLHPADPFFIQLEVSMMGGAIFALPFVLYFVAEFVLPALTTQEKKYLLPVFVAGALLFVIGIVFCYFLVLPQTFAFFLDYSKMMGVEARWTMQNYIDFTVQMLLGIGISFEFPLVLIFLNVLGFLPGRILREYRRHAIVLVVIIAACITPGSDPFSLAALSIPLYLLYEISLWVISLREWSVKRHVKS